MNGELIEKKKRIVEHYLKQKILLSREVLQKLQHEEHIVQMYKDIDTFHNEQSSVQESSTSTAVEGNTTFTEVNRHITPQPATTITTPQTEQKNNTTTNPAEQNPSQQQPFDSNDQTEKTESKYKIEIKKEYYTEKQNFTVRDWVSHFTVRFRKLEQMIQQRSELQNLTSIRRLTEKNERETVSIIGMVYEKSETRNGNLAFTIEDLSGRIKVIVSKKSPSWDTAQDTQPDEVVGIVGSLGTNVIFANNIIYPDIPMATEIKKSPDEVYMCVPSDPQIGSKLFLPERFENFINWTRGEFGSPQQREVARKTKYIIIPGDVIEGVGIFPGQEEELEIKNVRDQYKKFADYLRRIPLDKEIVVLTGNHDACKIAEPQPRIYEEYAPDLYTMPNVHLVTNPSVINIHKSEDFPGFNILLYHGFSYVYYGDNVQSIKDSGLPISDRTGIIMKYLLQRRHLAPAYTSTRMLPNPKEDCLVIEDIPDFFMSGHIHKAVVTNHRGVSIIVGSCFMSTSSYQEKFGHVAIPGQVPLVNLKTRKITMMEF